MRNNILPEDCCGCTACASVCTHDAIKMTPDSFGFYYPSINTSKCVNCGLCDNVCQFNDNYDKSLNLEEPIAYAARHKNDNEVLESRSGAAFVAISDYIIDKGGIVYGAGYKDHFRVCHKRAVTKYERDEFRGSKYVQSDLIGVFGQVKNDLKNGYTVLFSGTPCQTSALRSFVGKNNQDDLILIDIVCHGVPSPNIWRDYLAHVESKHKSKIIQVNFRDKKRFGWKNHKESFVLDSGAYIADNLYTELFYKNIILRKSCSNCHFTNLKRPSDITLADFWGWEKAVPDMNVDDKGISLVLINTNKGVSVFNSVKHNMNIRDIDIHQCQQARFTTPAMIHPLMDVFEKNYAELGFEPVLHKFFYPSFIRKCINRIKYGRKTI